MPRFSDEWVIDRVLFDYVSGGSCACCGLQHFLPNGTADLINAVSDLETDQATQEVAALANHPWPPELRDQVWADRVRLRQRLKKENGKYESFWTEHGPAFRSWSKDQETVGKYKRWFQLPRSEIMELMRQKYKIHSAYGVVLCAVMEQVAGFELTKYPPDGRGDVELNFEGILKYDRRGGFTLVLTNDDVLLERNLDSWLARMESLGQAKLLERGKSPADSDEGDTDIASPQTARTSFQSDRRIVRLLIARFFADIHQEKFLASEER